LTVASCTLAVVVRTLCTSPLLASTPMCAFIPKCQALPFFVDVISRSRFPDWFFVLLAAATIVASTTVPDFTSKPRCSSWARTRAKISSAR